MFTSKTFLFALSIAVYIALFGLIDKAVSHGTATAAIIPVVAAGWLFGMRAGIIAGLCIIPANVLLCIVLAVQDWFEILFYAGLPGHFAIIGCGAVVGRIHDLNIRLSRELAERELAQEKAREQNDFLSNIIKTTGDGIYVTDERGYIVEVNKAFTDMTGFTKEEMTGKFGADIFAPAYETVAPPVEGEIFTEDFFDGFVVAELEKKDGTSFPVEAKVTQMERTDGTCAGLVGAVRDISRRQEAEKALRVSEARFRAIAESTPDAVITADSDNTIIYWNRGAEHVFGYGAEEITGKKATVLLPERLQKDNAERFQYFSKRSGENFTGKTFEAVGVRKNGEEFPLEQSLSTWTIDRERFFISIIRDLSDRKKAEQEHITSEKFRAMLEIAGGICHEMNQPLQALLGNIELLELQTPPESPVQKKLTAIKAQVLSISDITKKLLHLTSYKTKDYIRQQIIDIDKSSES